MRAMVDGALILSFGFGGALLTFLAAPLQAGGPLLVLAAPWNQSADDIVARSGGRPVTPTSRVWATIASSADPNFASALRAAGAIAVFDGTLVLAFCESPQT